MILVINNNINNLYCIIYKQSHVKRMYTSQRGGTSKEEIKRDRQKKNVCMHAGEKENSTV